jgi:GTPase involved in cell partitioning and DNA repair
METLATTFGQLATQTETLEVSRKHQPLFIGIPKETTLQENRVALVPHSVATLTAHGHRVVVEAGAGEKPNSAITTIRRRVPKSRTAGKRCTKPTCCSK